MSTVRLAVPACLMLLITTIAQHDALAVTRNLSFQANATGVCQAALPAYEGLIRKKPMGVFNESESTAFVTCSPTSVQNLSLAPSGHALYFYNPGSTAMLVNCTAVLGTLGSDTPEYIVKSVMVDAESGDFIYWSEADGVTTARAFNVSCALPVGVGVTATYMRQVLDVGN